MRKQFRIYINAPITLAFVGICSLALILAYISNGLTTDLFFSTYNSSLLNILTYVRLICHVFGHVDFNHFISNILYILLLGPILEEKYHQKLINVIFVTALVTGIFHNIFFPNTILLGASGVVFAFILLASVTGGKEGIPITLILVAIFWLGSEIYSGLFSLDNISQITHIIGGISGAVMGLIYRQ